MKRVVIIGAGVGGLTAAATLARAGWDVTVLEAHVYAGGCAGVFYHQGYRFEAGATLAGGFYPGGPMDLVAAQTGVEAWPAHATDAAMQVHLSDGAVITRWGDERRWQEHTQVFGQSALPFWRWQEQTADAMWDLALRLPEWPPQTPRAAARLLGSSLGWLQSQKPGGLATLAADALRPAAAHLRGASSRLREFIDAQLLISSQTTSAYANALYAASALDLPRRGVVHLEGGIGAIAGTLVKAVRQHGGQVHFRQEATRIVCTSGRPVAVETKRGSFPADIVIANLPPWNIARLLGEAAPPHLRQLPAQAPNHAQQGWGAFMVYAGFDAGLLPPDLALHHQVITRLPLGEGNSIFLSLSPSWDASRAPAGRRALTISTHTLLAPWWDLFERDRTAYEARKEAYADRLLLAAERVLPGLRDAADLILPGTPVTFQRFTRRAWGWVGGFPQTSLFQAWGPRLAPGLWMVGDSIFPGQSTAAVALGGLRVAKSLIVSTE